MILSMQTISKTKVSNYYNFGKKLQKWCKEHTNLVLDTIGCGYMDGGCRVLAEALQVWSKGYLVPKVMYSTHGDEHVVSTLKTDQGYLILLDADGMGSMENLRKKMHLLEGVECDYSVKALSDNTTIKNYRDTHPDLIKNIADTLQESFGDFKPSMIIKGLNNIQLPTVITGFETPICDLNEVLTKNDQLYKIPKTSRAADLLSFLFTPVKNIEKVDYLQVFRTIADRDGWAPTEDDYCTFITKYFKEVKHDTRAKQADFLPIIPPWGPKAAKLYFKYIIDDLHDVLYRKDVIYSLENQLGSKSKPLIAFKTEDGITEYTHKGDFMWADNKTPPSITYIKDEWFQNRDAVVKALDEQSPKTLVSLIELYQARPDLKIEILDFISQHIQVKSFVYSDMHTILNDMQDSQKTTNMKNAIFNVWQNVSIERILISMSQEGTPSVWIDEFLTAAINNSSNTRPLFYNLYKYPEVCEKINSDTISKLVDSFISQSYHFINLDEHNLEDLSNDEALLYLVTKYCAGREPEIIKMMDTARLVNADHPFEEFKKMYHLRNQANEAAVELPSL